MTVTNREPTVDELEAFFVNNQELERIDAYLNRLNPIKTMKMEAMEIRHSAILAWLLDPNETHGLDDRFLKAFIAGAFRGCSHLGKPNALDIIQSDLRDAEIRREWQHIDILVVSRANGWAFVIENKFNSSQHEDQLSKYTKRIRSIFDAESDNLIVRGIFLTLFDEEPQDESYAPIRYELICEILSSILKQDENQLSQSISVFLHHYLEIIEEATGMSEERQAMEKLAKQLYRKHRKVIDFVNQHGAITDFTFAVDNIFGDDVSYGDNVSVKEQEIIFLGKHNSSCWFLPKSWFDGLGRDQYYWHGCSNWWAGYPLICWVWLVSGNDGAKGQLRLYAEVGPLSNSQFRIELIESIKEAAAGAGLKNVKFQQTATEAGKKYSKFLKDNIVPINDINDADEIQKAIENLIRKFGPVFDAVSNVIPQFIKYGALEDEEN